MTHYQKARKGFLNLYRWQNLYDRRHLFLLKDISQPVRVKIPIRIVVFLCCIFFLTYICWFPGNSFFLNGYSHLFLGSACTPLINCSFESTKTRCGGDALRESQLWLINFLYEKGVAFFWRNSRLHSNGSPNSARRIFYVGCQHGSQLECTRRCRFYCGWAAPFCLGKRWKSVYLHPRG